MALLRADGVVHQDVPVLRDGDDLVPVGVVGNQPNHLSVAFHEGREPLQDARDVDPCAVRGP